MKCQKQALTTPVRRDDETSTQNVYLIKFHTRLTRRARAQKMKNTCSTTCHLPNWWRINKTLILKYEYSDRAARGSYEEKSTSEVSTSQVSCFGALTNYRENLRTLTPIQDINGLRALVCLNYNLSKEEINSCCPRCANFSTSARMRLWPLKVFAHAVATLKRNKQNAISTTATLLCRTSTTPRQC